MFLFLLAIPPTSQDDFLRVSPSEITGAVTGDATSGLDLTSLNFSPHSSAPGDKEHGPQGSVLRFELPLAP